MSHDFFLPFCFQLDADHRKMECFEVNKVMNYEQNIEFSYQNNDD